MRLKDYDYIGTIDNGAFATVQKRKHRTLGTVVAVKLLSTESMKRPDYVGWFSREIRIMADLGEHAHIVKIIDSEVTEEQAWLMMPLAKQNLFDYMQRHNAQLKLGDRLELFEQVLSAMALAHQKNILHRDLAPQNVLVFEENGKIVLKVADFGLGKRLDSGSVLTTSHDNKFGRLSYTAPEVYDSFKTASKASDVFSMGKLLQFILTGKTPNVKPKDEFRSLILKSTEEDPNDRYQSAQEFAEALITRKNYVLMPSGPPKNLVTLANSDAMDWNAFHQAVLSRKFNHAYDDFVGPINSILLAGNAIEDYVKCFSSELNEFVRAYIHGLNSLGSVGWPFSAVGNFCDLLRRIYDSTNNDDVKLECLKQIWEYAYPRDRWSAQDCIDRLIPSIPENIQHDFAEVMLKSIGKVTSASRLDAVASPPSIRKVIDILVEQQKG